MACRRCGLLCALLLVVAVQVCAAFFARKPDEMKESGNADKLRALLKEAIGRVEDAATAAENGDAHASLEEKRPLIEEIERDLQDLQDEEERLKAWFTTPKRKVRRKDRTSRHSDGSGLPCAATGYEVDGHARASLVETDKGQYAGPGGDRPGGRRTRSLKAMGTQGSLSKVRAGLGNRRTAVGHSVLMPACYACLGCRAVFS